MKYNLKILIHLTFCEYELIVIFLDLRHFKCLGLMENHVLLNSKTSVWRPIGYASFTQVPHFLSNCT